MNPRSLLIVSLLATACTGLGQPPADPAAVATARPPRPQVFQRTDFFEADGVVPDKKLYATIRSFCPARLDVRICGKGERTAFCSNSSSSTTVSAWTKPNFWDINADLMFRELTPHHVETTGGFEVWIRKAYDSKSQGEWAMVQELAGGHTYALDIQKDCKTVKPRPEPTADAGWGCYAWEYTDACGQKERTSYGRQPLVACESGPMSIEGDEKNALCEVQRAEGLCRIRYAGKHDFCLRRPGTDGSWGGEWKLTVKNPTCKRDVEIDTDSSMAGHRDSRTLQVNDTMTVAGKDAPLFVTLRVLAKDLERWDVGGGEHTFELAADCKSLRWIAGAGGEKPKKVKVGRF